jgi:hypothetical protein
MTTPTPLSKKSASIIKTKNQSESIRSVLKSSTNSQASSSSVKSDKFDKSKIQEKPKEVKKLDINLGPNIERSENNEDIEYDGDTLKLHAELRKITNNLRKTHGLNLNLPAASVSDANASNSNVLTNNGGAVSSENGGTNLRILKKLKNTNN